MRLSDLFAWLKPRRKKKAKPREILSFETSLGRNSTAGLGAHVADPTRASIVADPIRAGRKALRIECRPDDVVHNRIRAEVVPKVDLELGRTYRFDWEFYFDEGFSDEGQGDWETIIWQIHHGAEKPGDMARARARDGHAGAPPLSLHLAKRYNTWGVALLRRTGSRDDGLVGSAPLRYGEWNSFAAEIRFSQDETGYVGMLASGMSLTSGGVSLGPTAINAAPSQAKLGQYRGSRAANTSTVFLGDIRIQEIA